MKYLSLVFAMVKGLALIGVVAWLLLQIRENFVYRIAILPWTAFTVLTGASLGAAFAFAAKACSQAIKKLKAATEESKISDEREK